VTQTLTYCPPSLSTWAAEVREDEEPTFIIDGIIPTDSLVLLSGEPKESKKTWLAMKLALIANTTFGEPLLVATRPTPVLYIYREGARKPTLARFEALLAHLKINPEQLTDFYFHHRGGFFLDDADAIGEVVKFVLAKGIKLVVVDTFAKSCRADENSAKEMGMAVAQAEKLRGAGATVLLVHHLRKGGPALSAGKYGSPEPDKDLRGSTALAGAYEMHLAIRAMPIPGCSEKQNYLLVGGKEADTVAYTYHWHFKSTEVGTENEHLESVTLELHKQRQLPSVAEPTGRRRRDDDGEGIYV
jgi:hypothetical protein